jgi:hypothetical protein
MEKKVKLQGLPPQPSEATPISANKLYNSMKGNDTWAYVILFTEPTPQPTPQPEPNETPPPIK